MQKTVLAIYKFTAIYRTVIIAFLLKRYCSKSVLLKLVLSVQFARYQITLFVEFSFRKTKTTYDKTCLSTRATTKRHKGSIVCSTKPWVHYRVMICFGLQMPDAGSDELLHVNDEFHFLFA